MRNFELDQKSCGVSILTDNRVGEFESEFGWSLRLTAEGPGFGLA